MLARPDFGDLAGAAGARQRTHHSVSSVSPLSWTWPWSSGHRLGELVHLLDDGLRGLLDARLGFFLGLGVFALVILQELGGQIERGFMHRRLRRLQAFPAQRLEIAVTVFRFAELLARDIQLAFGRVLGLDRRVAGEGKARPDTAARTPDKNDQRDIHTASYPKRRPRR